MSQYVQQIKSATRFANDTLFNFVISNTPFLMLLCLKSPYTNQSEVILPGVKWPTKHVWWNRGDVEQQTRIIWCDEEYLRLTFMG